MQFLKNLCFSTLVFFCFLLTIPADAQETLFKNGDRVCFVGNSITHDGRFHHNIAQYYITRFPDSTVHFFNCGISGDVTGGILKRLRSDVLVHNPTHVVLMIGMNDVDRSLYGNNVTTNADTLRRREMAGQTYASNLKQLIRLLQIDSVKVILQSPSIYDQTAKLATPNNFGVNDELGKYAQIGEKLAEEFGLLTVDYWSVMNDLSQYVQEADPKATIIGNDRIHPGDVGHFIMTNQFLEATDADRYVSYIHVDQKSGPVKCVKCTVENFIPQKNGVSFDLLETALPFVLTAAQTPALELVEFTQYFNAEEVVVENLAPGIYNLSVDGVVLDKFTDQRFREGVNLAVLEKAAQYKQSERVNEILQKMWIAEGKLRDIKWVEYGHLSKMDKTDDKDAIRAFLNERYESTYAGTTYASYYKKQFDNYLLFKPSEQFYTDEIVRLNALAYTAARPVSHKISVKKM